MLDTIVHRYQLLVNNLGQLIEMSGYRNDYLAQKIGLKAANFSIKKQKGNWSTDEVLKILAIIENDEIENFMDEVRMNDQKKGSYITSSEFEKRMGWK